jgi:predicted metal-dependent phosphoesterase TrpH
VVADYYPPARDRRACQYWWYDAWDWLVNRALQLSGTPRILAGSDQVAIDPHIHSMFSHCSIARPDQIVDRAVRLGLGAIAVLDHNDVEITNELRVCVENLKRKKAIPDEFLIVPGVEISSSAGHIAALFVEKPLPDGLSCEKTVRLIHEAGGLAVAVHPYHSTGIGDAVLEVPFDAMETYCGSVFNARLVKMNADLALDVRLKRAAKLGYSDAHYLQGIGSCYTVLELTEPTPEAMRAAIVDRRTSPRMSRQYTRLKRLLGRISRLG